MLADGVDKTNGYWLKMATRLERVKETKGRMCT